MTRDLVDRLLAESAHLPPLADPELDALRWAVLVEDVLGVVLTDDQITTGDLTDPGWLRSLLASSAPPG